MITEHNITADMINDKTQLYLLSLTQYFCKIWILYSTINKVEQQKSAEENKKSKFLCL